MTELFLQRLRLWWPALPVLLCMAAVGWFGYDIGRTAGQRDLAAYRAQVTEQRQRDSAAALQRYQARTEQLAAVSGRLDAALTDLDATRDQLKARIPHAAQRPAPAVGAADAGLLSVDGLRFYNAALGLRADARAAAAGQPDAADAAAGAADSGVSRADLLAHVADYGAWCRQLAAQRDALIKIEESGHVQ
ncbi:hypothetical protein CEK28_04815 [Xenophilus sp. AP218F]|nr:hypothetical protein CEK28_04815 [Xenophilus sp. AP218F]